ncbi:MAG: MFS transporter [Deltaproteobacteria bacterium]|nr:MFS transporter [Deltaproteobacteria bacterium]
MPKPSDQLTFFQLAAYAAPSMVIALAVIPVNAVLPTLYSQRARVSITAVGAIFMLRSIYDALSDQLIGFLSDRTRTRLGARLPWIIAGSAVTLLGMIYLFRIPSDAGVFYFCFWTIVFFTGATMVGIPHYAWGHELSPDYNERARVFGFKGVGDNIGGMLFSVIPIALLFFGLMKTTDYTPDMVWLLGMIVMIALPIAVVWAWLRAPLGHVTSTARTSVRGLIRSVIHNKPFIRFFSAYIIAGTGYGVFVALIFPFISTYLKIGYAFPHILLATTIAGIVSVPFWVKVVYHIGKHRAWVYGWIANSLVLVPIIWVEPGESAAIPASILMGLYGFTNGVSMVAPFAILGDIIDYDNLKTGVDRGGNYFAFIMLAVKLLGSTGGIALIILGSVFGYDLSEKAVNSDFANLGMLYMFIGAPALFQLASLPLVWNFPIDARRHGTIRRRLEQREARAACGETGSTGCPSDECPGEKLIPSPDTSS